MKKVLLVAIATALATLSVTSASAKDRKAAVAPGPVEVKRSLLSGGESHFQNFYGLYSNCTTTQTDVRIVKPPSKGEIRFEEVKMVLAYKTDPVRRICHGKAIDAIRMYYKAKDDAAGRDTFLIDVDTKLGAVQRYAYTVDIR